MNRSGFTLAEVVIAVGVLAVVLMLAVPAMQSIGGESLEAAARVLAADLRLARSQAVRFNTEWTVRFDAAGHAYELVHTGTGDPPPLMNPHAPPGREHDPWRVELGRLPGAGRGQSAVRLGGAARRDSQQVVSEVTFGPTGGTGPAAGEDTIVWLMSGSGGQARYVRLTVSWITGQVWIDPPEPLDGNFGARLFQ